MDWDIRTILILCFFILCVIMLALSLFSIFIRIRDWCRVRNVRKAWIKKLAQAYLDAMHETLEEPEVQVKVVKRVNKRLEEIGFFEEVT